MIPSPKFIIVAEDEVLLRKLLSDFLTDAGFDVIEAAHARGALTVLESRAADVGVLLTGIQMPGSMDGLELAQRARTQWPWIGVIVVSGKARPGYNDLPADSRFLRKPYRFFQVIAHVQELMAA